jgi:hypothetical protein
MRGRGYALEKKRQLFPMILLINKRNSLRLSVIRKYQILGNGKYYIFITISYFKIF